MKFNYHTHCHYCDGKGLPQEYVEEALKQHFHSFGFSSHAPVPIENNFAIKESDIPLYISDIQALAAMYPQLPLSYGLECDYIPGLTRPFDYYRQQYGIQYIIGGVHLVAHEGLIWFIDGPKREIYDRGLQHIFHNDIRLAVKTYFYQLYTMLEQENMDILAHFDKIKMHNQNRYFSEDEHWYRQYMYEAIELIQQKGMVVELNTRGIYKNRHLDFYPSARWIKTLHEYHIPVTISMDAHAPEEISLQYEDAMECIRTAGYREIAVMHKGNVSYTGI